MTPRPHIKNATASKDFYAKISSEIYYLLGKLRYEKKIDTLYFHSRYYIKRFLVFLIVFVVACV